MKRIVAYLVPLLIVVSWTRAEAADFSRISELPVIVNLLILAGTVSCLIVSLKVLTLVRGGALSRPWQLIIVSFVVLAGAQFMVLFRQFGIFHLTFDVAGVLYAVTVVLWFAGIFHTRKVLG